MGKKKDAKKASKARASREEKGQKKAKAGKSPLKGLHCSGCKKACPLKDPRCKKGRAQAEAFLEKR